MNIYIYVICDLNDINTHPAFRQFKQPLKHIPMHEKCKHTHTNTHTQVFHLTQLRNYWQWFIGFANNTVTTNKCFFPLLNTRLAGIITSLSFSLSVSYTQTYSDFLLHTHTCCCPPPFPHLSSGQ